jgi:alanyl-tRNA synthetase
MTERLYYNHPYLQEFSASVVDASEDRRRIYLDRTAFYPTSGGQPHDVGAVNGIVVGDVVDEDGRVAHVLEHPLEGSEVNGRIDWNRRFDHMQQHSGQHLLSAVLVDLFSAPTVSFHLGADASTIDIGRSGLDPSEVRRAEQRANEIVFENRPVTISYGDSSGDLGLRKATKRQGTIRIISIEGIDRSACGGTHVRGTAEIGPILLRRFDKIRGNVRLEFLCGMRAVKRARADYEALADLGRAFSAPLDDVPGLVRAQMHRLEQSEKALRKMSLDAAKTRGGQLYGETEPDADGVRRIRRRAPSLTDELRAEAQGFTSGSRSVFVLLADQPPSVLLAASDDSGVNAGQVLKDALGRVGGRGGGGRTLAQGSVPSEVLLDNLVLL